MSLYLTLELCAIIMPLALSFDKKVAFYKNWPVLFPSIVVTGSLFIVLDIYFTARGIWGFNPRYHSGIMIANLPLEEWLFFLVIPYSSIFIHYVLISYFRPPFLTDLATRIISALLIVILFLVIVFNHERTYTLFYSVVMIIALLAGIFDKTRVLNSFFISFLVILIPFIIINGILTGSFIPGEVVWYNGQEIIGVRIFTIPVEDFVYGFSMIFINLLLMNYFRKILS